MRLWVPAVILGALAFIGVSAAQAANVAGTWNCCGSGGSAASVLHITDSGSSLGGTAALPSGEVFATIGGTLNGSSVKIVETYNSFDPGYVATFVGAVSSDGKTMSGTWTTNEGQSGTWSATEAVAAVPPPVLGKSVDAAPVSGIVLLELPGGHKFVRLAAGKRIPLGSTVDVTHGVVAMTAAYQRGKTRVGQFYDGEFRVVCQRFRPALP
jgi:hypothetical protein